MDGCFKCRVGTDNSGERWRQALLDFSYCNVCFDLKQLIKALHCNLQVTIHQRLVEAQADILKVIASFIDHFHIKVTTLSAPQVHALLDHMHARCAGSHSFLAAIRGGTTSARPESFLERVLPTYFSPSSTDFQTTKLASTEVQLIPLNWRVRSIKSTLMLNFKSEITGIPTINLTGEEANIHYLPLRGNITENPKDNLDASTAAPGHSIH